MIILFFIQQILFSIELLTKYEKKHFWLDPDTKKFEEEYQNYIVNVAAHFF